jgi:hypothetical protein
MKRNLQRSLKRKIVTALQNFCYFLLDVLDGLMGKRDKFTRPRQLIFVGDDDFKKWEDELFKYSIDLGGLKPTQGDINIGCGIGSMAIPLAKFFMLL